MTTLERIILAFVIFSLAYFQQVRIYELDHRLTQIENHQTIIYPTPKP
jgi:hypothetical protein